jgi:DNA-directed RNA polymerase II subunit RPB9
MFTCRTCHVAEPATSPCVYQNKLNIQVGDTAGVTQDVGSDPTVGLPEFCLHCGDEIACSVCGMLSTGPPEENYPEYENENAIASP